MRILPIASGKGGVGKSLLAANLAIVLGEAGKSVILCTALVPCPWVLVIMARSNLE